MTNKPFRILLPLLFLTSIPIIAHCWGSWGHRHINKAAVFPLPQEMRSFYYNHIDYITESSVVPDLRKYWINDRQEGHRHFIDIEDFDTGFEGIPKEGAEAFKKYDSTFLSRTGILPWYIIEMTNKLTRAFKNKNKGEILFISSEIAHYIADAHMPLHTSSNYNGQLTGQNGVHSLWENTLPQTFGSQFNLHTPDAVYFSDITKHTWKIIEETHHLVQPLLEAEKRTREQFNELTMYKKDAEGKTVMFYNDPVFSDAYAATFQKELGSMVEKQMQRSIQQVASYWFTAWVNAGKPDLTELDSPQLTSKNRKNLKKEYRKWNTGKILYLVP